MARTPTHRLRLATPSPFELDVVLRGHGWVALGPHRYTREAGRLVTSLDLAAVPGGCARDPVVRVEARQSGPTTLALEVRGRRALTRPELTRVRAALITTLALDRDLAGFWARCAEIPRLAWVAERGAGRLLRSPTVFEDLLKLLLTTNCAWANTEHMVARLIAALGRRDPSGAPAFPSAQACAREPESFWRDEVRVGYRARHCRALAAGFASGALRGEALDDPRLSTAQVRDRLLALPGFGPYAAGQALRLLGRFDDLALDSWVRKRAAELHGLAPSDDRAIARRYAEHGSFAGLALWMDVTADWHQR